MKNHLLIDKFKLVNMKNLIIRLRILQNNIKIILI